MDSEFEDDNCKTYTNLDNYNHESMEDSKLHFEKFLMDGNSESEEEYNENYLYSDGSNGFEEERPISEDPRNDLSNGPEDFSLTCGDWNDINSSQPLELSDLIKMNRNEKFMLLQLFHKIKGFLIEVQNKIKPLKQSSERKESKDVYMFLGHIGAPYFKTKKEMFGSGSNPDTLDRKERGILSIYQTGISPRWSKNECDNLTRGVKLNYNINKQKALLKEIAILKRRIDNSTDSDIISEYIIEINKLEVDIKNLKLIGIADLPPLTENKLIDWEHISTEYLKDKHNARECSSFWFIYLHPDINKSNWSKEENAHIKRLAIEYNTQNWDQIALELGTNRTGFTVFLHYSSVLCNELRKTKFSEEEDRKILQLVESNKLGSYIPWNTIADLFLGRTKMQIKHRYKYYLRDMEQRTQKFSDAEDIMILILVERFGRNYVKFTKYLPFKSYMQIKSRYDNHLRFSRIRGSFSLEEDREIMNHLNHMNQDISSLASRMNRNRLQLRQRYNKLTEFFNKHPDKSLEDLPRRLRQNNGTFRRMKFLQYVVDRFKDQDEIPTLDEIAKKLGKTKKLQQETDIDTLLVNFLTTSYMVKKKSLDTTAHKIKTYAEKMFSLLKMFGCNLRIPADIKKNNTFDIIDLEILHILRNKDHSFEPEPVTNELLPPDLHTTIGLRGLLMKNQLYKKTKDKKTTTMHDTSIRNLQYDHLASELEDIFNNMNSNIQNVILDERRSFSYRFTSTFMWPALLSIESPSVNLFKMGSEFVNSKQGGRLKQMKGESSRKSTKRKLDGNINTIPAKKNKSKGECNNLPEVQPTRSSIRLKNKKERSNENELLDREKIQSVEIIKNSNDINETAQGHLNLKNTNEKVEKIDVKDISSENKKKSTSKLVKLNETEIMKLLQSKKPIKIIRIQHSNASSLSFSNLSAFSDNLRNKNKTGCSTSNSQDRGSMDLCDIKNNHETSVRLSTGKVKSQDWNTTNLNVFPQTANKPVFNSKDAEDLDKLDNFLNSVEQDDVIDLTENEVMKNEIEQLDQLIKQESAFGSK